MRFSVIIPAYNAGETIKRAVDSALSQVGVDVEVVVCDDGSTDDTARFLASYGDRIVVVTKSNGGLSSARNAAIFASSGDWLVLLDADDEWLPGRLAAIRAAVDADEGVGLVTTDAIVRADGQPDRRYYATKEFPISDQRTAILRDCFIFVGAAFRRTLYDSLGGFDEGDRYNTEYEFWIRALLSGERAALVEDQLAIYYRAAVTMSTDRGRTWRRVASYIERAITEGRLSVTEHRVAEEALKHALGLALSGEAVAALQRQDDDVRLRCLAVARQAGPVKRRAKFLVAAALPACGRRHLAS